MPTTIGRTPKLAGSKLGDQSVPNRNSNGPTSSKKPIVGPISEITIAVVVTTESRPQKASRPLITFSPVRLLGASRGLRFPAPGPEAPIEPASMRVLVLPVPAYLPSSDARASSDSVSCSSVSGMKPRLSATLLTLAT